MIHYAIAFGTALVLAVLAVVICIKTWRKLFREIIEQLHQDFNTARGYRDNADRHIQKLQEQLITSHEAYGQLLTTPPEERARAYIEELQELLRAANNLALTVGPVLEITVDNEADPHLAPEPVPIPSDLRAAIRDLGKAQNLWSKSKSEYLVRGNGPSPTQSEEPDDA